MARWDAAGLVRQCKNLALRPDTDEMMTDRKWCAFLSLAQEHWMGVIAAHVPESQYGAPVALTLAGDSKSATFPDGVRPTGRVALYDGMAGRRLVPGDYHDPAADFVIEAAGVRAPLDRTFSFPQGLYARYVDVGDLEILSADAIADGEGDEGEEVKEPVLQPEPARILLVYHALALYASMGGFQDPSYWEHKEIVAAFDDPETGSIGWVTRMKTQYADQAADSGAQYVWWRSSDLGNLRHRIT